MAVTKEQIAELYVAYFNRAPDTAGLDYWMNTGSAIEEISSSFYVQPETGINYPDSMTDSIFVNTIYKNVFNRDAEPDGLVYWENELANETITRPNMILAITNGAKDTDTTKDATILANKTEVGLYSADAGVSDVDKAKDLMKDVDSTTSSVTDAKELADNYAVLTLTTKQDAIVAGANDDTITGLITAGAGSTYTGGDTIDGGEGKDTFKLQIAGAGLDASASIKNVETVEISGSVVPMQLNAFNWTETENYSFVNAATNTINHINHAVYSVLASNVTVASNQILDFQDKNVQDTNNDKLDVTIKNSSQVFTLNTAVNNKVMDIYEELDIHSNGNINGKATGFALGNAADVVKTVVDGDSDITIFIGAAAPAAGAGVSNETLDASALTGKLNYASNSSAIETIKGGSGDDTITAGATGSNIWGGAGQDTLNGAGGIDNFKYDKLATESGLKTATADIIINFTSGTDTISFRGLEAGSADNFYTTNTKSGVVNSIETAVAEANKGILTNKMYVEYTGNKNGNYLVIDSDGDGKADSAIQLGASIVSTDIVIY